ncbi:hypothetical protein ACFZDP_47550 [Streptomyces mirabilis]|uniref:hypothetical protein n=1 Tax=Streptomyces mirabilis TaxID=68239 RepID=UPI0036EF7E18
MLVLAEDAAEAVASADVEMDESVGFEWFQEANRFAREYGIAHTPGQENALGSSPDLPRPV